MPDVRRLRQSTESNQNDSYLGQKAIQVAAILPSDLDQAIKVLELAKQIVTEFLH